MKFFILVIAVFFSTILFAQKKPSKSTGKGFITSLKKYQGNDTIFKTKQGHFIDLSFIPDEDTEMQADAPALAPNCNSTAFGGTDRKKCKTSIATAPVKSMSLSAFISTLPSDSLMMANPLISKNPNNPRVAEENHNIQLTGILLFAIKRENDNDYHMIIGDTNKTFFNVEISGLPASSAASFKKLAKTRTTVDAFFGSPTCNMGGYNVFPKGIKIQVTGSTFYDIDHAPGVVGPTGFKPATAWEIHPVTDIKFLQ